MFGKKIFFSLNLAFTLGVIHAANLKLPSMENLLDLIFIEEKFSDSINTPMTIKEERAALSPTLEPVLTPEKDVTFHLFTRSNPEEGYGLKVGDLMNLNGSPLRPDKTLKIIIHGWTDKGTTNWLTIIRKNYLFSGDYNVIIVNWYPTSTKEYSVAAKLTEQVGAYVGELLDFITSSSNISLSDVHILGHSLGAHVAGFAGSKLSGNVGRITGMDPARPAFEAPIYKDQKSRLDPSDAMFVDVIHTCAGTLGFVTPVGHADFYPHGGFRQPGCSPIISQYCSHGRSHQLMAESITAPHAFMATKCDSWAEYKAGRCSENSMVVMGEKVSTDARGTYFFDTNSEPPYGRGNFKSV